jgi:hypothetical protein
LLELKPDNSDADSVESDIDSVLASALVLSELDPGSDVVEGGPLYSPRTSLEHR